MGFLPKSQTPSPSTINPPEISHPLLLLLLFSPPHVPLVVFPYPFGITFFARLMAYTSLPVSLRLTPTGHTRVDAESASVSFVRSACSAAFSAVSPVRSSLVPRGILKDPRKPRLAHDRHVSFGEDRVKEVSRWIRRRRLPPPSGPVFPFPPGAIFPAVAPKYRPVPVAEEPEVPKESKSYCFEILVGSAVLWAAYSALEWWYT